MARPRPNARWWMLGVPLGPLVGGYLLQHYYWGSVFWINLPVAALALAAGAALLRESRNPAAPRPDLPGLLLAVGAVVALVYGFISAPEAGWASARTITLLAAGPLLLTAFALWERRAADRLIDPALFRNARFAWGTAAAVAVSIALFVILFIVPQYLQAVLGYSAFGTGLRLIPLMAGLLVGGGLAGPVDRLIGTRLTVPGGLVLLAAGLIVLAAVHADGGYPVLRTAAGEAFTGAMSPVLLSCAGVVLLGALLCLCFLPARRLLPQDAAVTG